MVESKTKTLDNIEKNLITLAFFGYTSAGKTSFINAILSEILKKNKKILYVKKRENTNWILIIMSSQKQNTYKI